MRDFIIEEELENVKDKNTREYLREIISTYNVGNYRLTIVGLYITLIYDLLYKVKYLKDIYKNEIAEDIINDIDNIKKEFPNSPVWEEYIIYRVTENFKNKSDFFKSLNKYKKINMEKECLSLFDKFMLRKIMRLKEDRNLCSHPTTDGEKLRNFHRVEAKSHIINMFEIVFLRDYVEFTNIEKSLKYDLETYSTSYNIFDSNYILNKNILNELELRYVSRVSEKVKELVFKCLWKIINNNKHCEIEILSFRLFLLIIEKNKKLCIDWFRSDKQLVIDINMEDYSKEERYYNYNLTDSYSRLLYLFHEHQEFWNELPETIKSYIRLKYKEHLESYLLADFLEEPEEHFNNVNKLKLDKRKKNTNIYFDGVILKKLYDKYKRIYHTKDIYDKFLLNIANNINSYDEATSFLENVFISIINDGISKECCIKYLDIFEGNNQVYDIGKYNDRHKKIDFYMKQCKEDLKKIFGEDFKYDKYKKLELNKIMKE